jgi:hypothetical protein
LADKCYFFTIQVFAIVKREQKIVMEIFMDKYVAPWVRVTIMTVSTIALLIIAYMYTGSVFPKDSREALVFQNALLLIVLGSSLLEHHFTKPADSVFNSLTGLITLFSVFGVAPRGPWIIAASYCVIVFIVSMTCVIVSTNKDLVGWKEKVANITYNPAVILGRSRIIFSVIFLFGLWFFYTIQNPMTISLIIFWGIFLALWPLKIPEMLSSWAFDIRRHADPIGTIMRIDDPNISRVVLDTADNWVQSNPKICILPDGKSRWLIPLYSQFQNGKVLGTGLISNIDAIGISGSKNIVYNPSQKHEIPSAEVINNALGGEQNSKLVGFIVERSSISTIRFETIDSSSCSLGMLLWVNIEGERVFYQLIAGETNEESFASDKHGYQIASAVQCGVFNSNEGLTKFNWLPAMNTPVFSSAPGHIVELNALKKDDFVLGHIPGSKVAIGGNFMEGYNYHTAILGVTGSGKTELAFDMIRHSVKSGIKVVCIDLTKQYEKRLSDMNPVDLSINSELAQELSDKLFAVETGQYGAGQEKKALGEFSDQLRISVDNSIRSFLIDSSNSNLSLICLEEISNTKAMLYITELYMTCLLKYARENIGTCPKILIVVEEAHTVMPEANTMGLGDFDSKGLVGKISQIALQGRKYGVGLLVLAQRTATVSKTILTQCNTIISFACYDDTSLGFLRNIFGADHVELIPNLPRLNAVVFGQWVKTEKPIVFEVPFKANPGEIN